MYVCTYIYYIYICMEIDELVKFTQRIIFQISFFECDLQIIKNDFSESGLEQSPEEYQYL